MESHDLCLEELSRVEAQQTERLESFQAATQELQTSLALESQRWHKFTKAAQIKSSDFSPHVSSALILCEGLKDLKMNLQQAARSLKGQTHFCVILTLLAVWFFFWTFTALTWCSLLLTEEALEQSAQKKEQMKSLGEELVRSFIINSTGGSSVNLRPL